MTNLNLPPEPIEISAGRIQLRPWEERLAPELFEACEDPDLARLPGGPPGTSPAAVLAWIAGRPRAWAQGEQLSFAAQEPTTAALLGGFDLREFTTDQARLVGWVTPAARRRGVATAVVGTLSRWAFGALDLGGVRLEHAADDTAACELAHRCGFLALTHHPDGRACRDGRHLRQAGDPSTG